MVTVPEIMKKGENFTKVMSFTKKFCQMGEGKG